MTAQLRAQAVFLLCSPGLWCKLPASDTEDITLESCRGDHGCHCGGGVEWFELFSPPPPLTGQQVYLSMGIKAGLVLMDVSETPEMCQM